MISARLLLPLLLLLSGLSIWLALISGSIPIGTSEVWTALYGHSSDANSTTALHVQIVRELRLPRAMSAFVTGALLALAGALMQVLLRNPLADPYILGVSGGAAVAALMGMLLGLSATWIPGSAFAGALITMLLVFGLSHSRGAWTSTRLLLTGVVVAAGWGAVISLLLAISPENQLRGMLFWLMGDLSQAGSSAWGWLVLLPALFITLWLGRNLNLLSHGDLQASALGVSTRQLRLLVYLLASLLSASAVTIAGSVGFVGLIVPHMIRLVSGSDHRLLLPASVFLGGSLVSISDTLARTLISPQQLPVGVITALIGVPLFLYLLYKDARGNTA